MFAPHFRRRWLRLLLLTIAPLQPAILAAQSDEARLSNDGSGSSAHADAPRAVAVRASGPFRIDGRLDEATWASATPNTGFTQEDPFEGQPVSERTDVRIAYDDEALYIGGMMYDTGPVTRRLARRDPNNGDFDYFSLILDSYHDHQTGYSFSVNASGTRRDVLMSGGAGGDASWDPVWDVATQITDEGWFLEMRIPFGQLRFSRDEVQTWGIQMQRNIDRKQELAFFSFTPKLQPGGIQRYGHLEGIRGVRPGRRLEILPYVGARAEYTRIGDDDVAGLENPYRSGSDYFGNAGLDLKYRITTNATLDATVNPDFGQVEVDPAVINLTAFETFFQEKRPFFIEGAEIFRFGDGGPMGSTGRGPQLLYSRRIGRDPQGTLPASVVYADEPTATTILGAAKLTGKTQDGWSFGLLEAVTGRETARWMDAAGTRDETDVEPLTNYVVGRLRRDARGGQTRIGLIGTTVHRDLGGTGLESRLRSEAYSAGFDFIHEWAERSWRLNGSFSPSYVVGEAAAILATQRSSARYFHRPDADHLEVDPDATSMGGYYAMLDLNEQEGNFQTKVALAGASPGYEVNDLGFQTAADRIILDTNFFYQQTRPGRFTRNWQVRGGPDRMWNFGGEEVFNENNVFGNMQFLNYWGMGWRLAYNMRAWDDRLTRGGPRAVLPGGFNGNLSFNSDSRKKYLARGNLVWRTDEEGSWETTTGLTVTYRPSANWQVSVGPELVRSYAQAQFVTSRADDLATETYGRRYLFGALDQTTLGIETRVNATFTPNLSFELYAQPFFSSGDYGPLKEFRAPDTYDFLVYGAEAGTMSRTAGGDYLVDPDANGPAASFAVPDPDFSQLSLLGNAVLRWEWRPGSTLYLVWQQSREERFTTLGIDPSLEGTGRFDFGRDARELFDLKPNNIFVIKMNYWLNP